MEARRLWTSTLNPFLFNKAGTRPWTLPTSFAKGRARCSRGHIRTSSLGDLRSRYQRCIRGTARTMRMKHPIASRIP